MLPTPEHIQHWMTLYAVTTRMLAEGVGYCHSHTRNLITGRSRITPESGPRIRRYFTERKAAVEAETAALPLPQIAA